MTPEDDLALEVVSQVGPWAMVPVWVLAVGLTGAELAVYVALRSYADRQGDARPYVRTLALRAGVSPRTAERALARFRELNLVRTTQRRRPDGSTAGLAYRLRDVAPRPAVSGGPDERDGGPPDERDGGVPTGLSGQRTHQENTPTNTQDQKHGVTPGGTSPGDARWHEGFAPEDFRTTVEYHANKIKSAEEEDHAG